MSPLRVLVVGASIAGPASAYWLSRIGAHVTVIERFPALRKGGQAVDIRTVGVAVMRAMTGMEALVRSRTTNEEGVSFVNRDGRSFGVIRASGDAQRQSIVSEYEIFRGDLSQILYDMTSIHPNITYIFDEQIASTETLANDKIQVVFQNDTPTAAFDLIVAADGLNSRTRAMALACPVRQHMISDNAWTAYFSTSRDMLDGSRVGHGFSAPGGRFVSLGADPWANGNRAMLISVPPRRNPSAMDEFRDASKKGEAELKDHVAERFRNAGWISDAIVNDMMHAQDFYASETARMKLPALHSGRFVFVGDAGYAAGSSGGGTSLALAGAYMLAGELSKCSGDLPTALQGYEDRMRPVIAEMDGVPAFVTTLLAPQSAWTIWVRNRIFAIIAWTNIAEYLTRYLGGAFADTKTYTLPSYEWSTPA